MRDRCWPSRKKRQFLSRFGKPAECLPQDRPAQGVRRPAHGVLRMELGEGQTPRLPNASMERDDSSPDDDEGYGEEVQQNTMGHLVYTAFSVKQLQRAVFAAQSHRMVILEGTTCSGNVCACPAIPMRGPSRVGSFGCCGAYACSLACVFALRESMLSTGVTLDNRNH